jgi:cell division FtsZ-interacting protein ZapD
MTDIVERLRQLMRAGDLTNEAADEIERLRDKLKACVDITLRQGAEIERLRNKLADWARRSESCESKLGQLEANERVIELEQLLAESQARKARLIAFIRKWVDVGPDNKEMMEDLERLELE